MDATTATDTAALLAELDAAAAAAYVKDADAAYAIADAAYVVSLWRADARAARPALPGDDIAAAIALLERHGYTVTPPGGHHG